MDKPILLLLVKKYLEESGLMKNSSFTTKILIKKVLEEATKASEYLKNNKNREALKEKIVNLIFLMTSVACISGINPIEEINKRIEEFKKGVHPILDELQKSL